MRVVSVFSSNSKQRRQISTFTKMWNCFFTPNLLLVHHNNDSYICTCLFHRLKHENLVDMVGFSCDGHHPCLVYAFMANGSLLDRLACLVSTISTGFCLLLHQLSHRWFTCMLFALTGRQPSAVMATEMLDS